MGGSAVRRNRGSYRIELVNYLYNWELQHNLRVSASNGSTVLVHLYYLTIACITVQALQLWCPWASSLL